MFTITECNLEFSHGKIQGPVIMCRYGITLLQNIPCSSRSEVHNNRAPTLMNKLCHICGKVEDKIHFFSVKLKLSSLLSVFTFLHLIYLRAMYSNSYIP